jgi:hypothetical protein
MAKVERVFHWVLTLGNGLICVTCLVGGNLAGAAVSGFLAAILAWQLTWERY